jgi:hypothetical protein
MYGRAAEETGSQVTMPNGEVVLWSGARPGVARSYTYKKLSRPRERKPGEIGPIGDFWRVWRGDATIKGDTLTINVEGGKPVVIDLVNPPEIPVQQAANDAKAQGKADLPQADEVQSLFVKFHHPETKEKCGRSRRTK